MTRRVTKKPAGEVPADSWGAFTYLVGKCATGVARELVEQGKTPVQARNAVINAFIAMAAGEACRVAREEGRRPSAAKWRKATNDAFARAVKRTKGHGEQP